MDKWFTTRGLLIMDMDSQESDLMAVGGRLGVD